MSSSRYACERPGSAASAIDWSFSVARSALAAVEVAELERAAPGRRRELVEGDGGMSKSRSRARSSAAPRVVEAADEAMCREHGQPRILERDEAYQDVAVLALAADLLGVGLHRLVAVVAVGDQQLGVARGGLDRGDRVAVGDAPEAMDRAVAVADLAPRLSPRSPARARSMRPGRDRSRARRSARCSRAWPSSGAGDPPSGPGWVRSCGRTRPAP